MPIPSTRPLCQAHPISLKRMLVGGVCGLLAVVSLPLAPTHAGAMPSPLHGVVSLSRVLRANGLLHHVNGSFDASGYRMLLGRGGAPRFVRAGTSGNRGESAHAASAADAGWSDRFGNVGVPNAGDIQAVAVAGPDVYIGGSFSSLSADANIPVNNVAMWNGHGWYSLGTGTNGEVDALAVSGNNVFAGGNFTNAGGVPANAIARWNGARWFGLAKGMTNTSYGVPDVRALAVKGSTLYAAGSFDNAGGVAAHSIAAWNGQTWKPLGSGMLSCDYFDKPNHCGSTANNGSVAALAVVGSKLYVGGQFNYVGSAERWGLAAWTGSAWAGVAGGGVEANTSAGSVDAIVSQGGALYVAGYFDHVGGSFASDGSLHGAIPASSVARLTLPGSTWHALGSGANNCQGCGDVNVGALTSWAGRLFMSGGFYGAGGDSTRNIAQWTGTAWKPVAGGLDSPANVLATIPQMGVVAAGYFTSSNGGAVILNHIGFWNGFRWTGYGQGLSLNTNAGFVNTVAAAGHTVYAGGLFSAAGWNPINNLARFDGTQWHSMGGGVSGGSGQPLAIATYGSLVFVGGDFTQAGPVAASNIAMWDGRHWHALQSGVDGIVRALLVYNGKLYVGGDFTHAGTNPASHLASWNLTTHRWSAVGGDPNYDSGDVQALSAITVAPNNHFLLIGGSFSALDDGASPTPNQAQVNGLVMFDTNAAVKHPFDGYYVFPGAKNSVGLTDNGSFGPYPGSVNALYADGLTIYVGGNFDDAGSIASHSFAVYNLGTAGGSGWKSPGVVGGGNSSGAVAAIVKVKSTLYIAGDFTTAGTAPADEVASFTPGSTPGTGHWSTLGRGITTGGFLSASCSALAANLDGLYVGGTFGLAGGKPSENIALWTPAHT